MAVVTEEPQRASEEERISEAPWDGSSGRFTDEQYEQSCVLDLKVCGGDWADKPPKARCSLPIKEPNGEISRAAVHAAASRIGSIKNAGPESIASAKAKLRSAYAQLGEDAPDSVKSDEFKDSQLDSYVERYAVIPGVARHNVTGSRGVLPLEFRDDTLDNGIGLMTGRFAVFNTWTEIDSFFEGRFMEQVAPGAFKKTFDENGDNIKVQFNHGRDPRVGGQLLGKPRKLEEDKEGAYYEVPLSDTSYNRDLLPLLRANAYGASFRFRVIREEVNTQPKRSDHNPEGIEERTITEAAVSEFGPVSFPAYKEATAGVRMRSTLEDVITEEMGGEAGYLHLTRSGRYHPYHFFFPTVPDLSQRSADEPSVSDAAEDPNNLERGTGPDSDGSTPEEATPERGEQEPAPPSDAPARDYLRATHLPGAARKPLRTTTSREARPWEL